MNCLLKREELSLFQLLSLNSTPKLQVPKSVSSDDASLFRKTEVSPVVRVPKTDALRTHSEASVSLSSFEFN